MSSLYVLCGDNYDDCQYRCRKVTPSKMTRLLTGIDMAKTEETYRCGYCQKRLPFDADETLKHVIRHFGEFRYLPVYHRHLERKGHDELGAHLLTLRAAKKLPRA